MVINQHLPHTGVYIHNSYVTPEVAVYTKNFHTTTPIVGTKLLNQGFLKYISKRCPEDINTILKSQLRMTMFGISNYILIQN